MNLTLSKISATKAFDGTSELHSSPISVLLDSSATDLYMPSVVCERFASAFGLIPDSSDPSLGSFTINSSVRNQLRQLNPLITFTLGDPIEPVSSVDIVLSYNTLDFAPSSKLDAENNTYFPIRAIDSGSSAVFGRRFFQEMYATFILPLITFETLSHVRIEISTSKETHRYTIVDFKRGNFSISLSAINFRAPNIIAISPPGYDFPITIVIYTLISILYGGMFLYVGICVCFLTAVLRWERYLKARLKALDQIWVQIHSVEPEEESEEGEQEVDSLEY